MSLAGCQNNLGSIQWLHGHNFAIFWPPPTSTWTFLTLNMDKNWHFWTTYQLPFVHVVIECPPPKKKIGNFWKKSADKIWSKKDKVDKSTAPVPNRVNGLNFATYTNILGLYMSSSFLLLQVEKERTACKAEKIHKMTTIFTQNGPRLSF